MPIVIQRREGPLFNEAVSLDGSGVGRLVGDLGEGKSILTVGKERFTGTLTLVPTEVDGGRATRTWVFNSENGRFANIFVGEEGLTAGIHK